jgi:hypothetical protein
VRRRPVRRHPPGHRQAPRPVGHILLPLVLITIGLLILIEGGAFGW